MPNFDITRERNFETAARRLVELERFAQRRAEFLDTLDLDALGPVCLCRIFREDEVIAEQIASGHLYLAHLIDMKNLAMSLATAA